MSAENYLNQPEQASNVETLLQDVSVQDGLKGVFAEIDNLYDGINTQTDYRCQAIGQPSITPTGVYVEAAKVALPFPGQGDIADPDHRARVAAYHGSAEYMIFAFNISEPLNPDFRLRPLVIDPANVSDKRGGGIDIMVPIAGDPMPVFDRPLNEYGDPVDEADYPDFDAHIEELSIWRRRNKIHLPQSDDDLIVYRGEPVEPFKTVRERAGVVL